MLFKHTLPRFSSLRLRLEWLDIKVLSLLLLVRENELFIGSTVDAKPPVERFSMKGFKKGKQAKKIATLSCIVVAR
jgi:hypothetical protein